MRRRPKGPPTPLKAFFDRTGVTQDKFAQACSDDRGAPLQQPRVSEWCWHEPSPANQAMIERVTTRFGDTVKRAEWRAWRRKRTSAATNGAAFTAARN